MKKIKINYYLICQILIIGILTFFAGYFLNHEIVKDNLKLFEILITIFGLMITLFTFIQGIIQNSKNNFLKSLDKKEIKKDKFIKLDNIVDELKGDVFLLLIMTLLFGGIALFFGGIENYIWQSIFAYIKFLIIFVVVFIVIDAVMTIFKLIQINNLLNLKCIDKDDKENENE